VTPIDDTAAAIEAAAEQQPSTDGRRVLFVHPGDRYSRLSGAWLRWDALAAAMKRSATVIRFEVDCTDGCEDHPTGPPVMSTPGWAPREDPYWYKYCPRVAQRLAQVAADSTWTLILASGLEMTRYLSEVPSTVTAPRVIDIRDVESRLRLEMARATRDRPGEALLASEESSRQLAALESAAVRYCDAIVTCTQDDKQTLTELYPITADRIVVLPNAVADPGPVVPSVPQRLVFIGNLRYFPCVQAAEFIISELVPVLRAALPQLPVLLAGANPGTHLLDSARAAGVAIADTPPDMEPYWRRAILAVPLRLGGGSRLKILEAFVRGCPVVSTRKGIEGIPAVPGTHYLLAESADEFVDAIGRLLRDDVLREAMTAAAREFVLEHNSIAAVADAFEQLPGCSRHRAYRRPYTPGAECAH
jgi:glycosyltransferase involved in cell wall biosynthesis